MRRQVTKEHAAKIIKKLSAEVVTSRRAHDLAQVYFDGKLIVTFGIRRGSNRDLPHPHIPADLSLTQGQTLDLANCPLTYEEWVTIMKQKGLI